jgi:hypothetical protein
MEGSTMRLVVFDLDVRRNLLARLRQLQEVQ